MSDIKQFRIGIMVYLFEVRTEDYRIPPKEFAMTPVTQKCYIPEPGSVAVYRNASGPTDMRAVNDMDLWFPADECENPDTFTLKYYEELCIV